jgi:hypothetical protein
MVAVVLLGGSARGAGRTYEAAVKESVPAYDLRGILRPFVATCDRVRGQFKKLFCTGLNERLKAQHQAKVYRITRKPSKVGPLVARFVAKPKPTVELEVRGCLTCRKPMLPRRGGDISKGRFFLFKLPEEIKIRRGRYPYDFGDITMAKYSAPLPEKTTAKSFKEQVLPHLRLDLLFRPVAGVTRVGRRHKYGVLNFELVGHRVYHKCLGKIFGASPKVAKATFRVSKNDLSCPQNQPKNVVAKVKLPSMLPQRMVKALMELVSVDLLACYEQFGVGGQAPTDIVVAPNGRVKHAKVVGQLAGTPTGKCVERLVKNLSFPKFSGEEARLQWPFSLKR